MGPRRERFIDIITGTNRAIPQVQAIIDEAVAQGKPVPSEKIVIREMHARPGDLLVSDYGMRRALAKIKSEKASKPQK